MALLSAVSGSRMYAVQYLISFSKSISAIRFKFQTNVQMYNQDSSRLEKRPNEALQSNCCHTTLRRSAMFVDGGGHITKLMLKNITQQLCSRPSNACNGNIMMMDSSSPTQFSFTVIHPWITNGRPFETECYR